MKTRREQSAAAINLPRPARPRALTILPPPPEQPVDWIPLPAFALDDGDDFGDPSESVWLEDPSSTDIDQIFSHAEWH